MSPYFLPLVTALAVFGGQLRDLRIDDDLRMCRKVLVRVAGAG